MENLKVTVLDIQPIDPPVGGGRLRLMGLYSGFKNQIDVTYVGSYDWRGPSYRNHKLSECLTEINVPLSEEHFCAHDTLALQLGKGCIDTAFPIQGHLSEEFVQKAREEAMGAKVVVFSHPWVFYQIVSTLDDKEQLVVYDSQNCEGLLRVKLLDDGTPIADDVCRATVRSECELCRAADLILACSQEDKDSFIHLYGIRPDKIIIVPNGVFTSKITLCEDQTHRLSLRKKLGLSKMAACFIGSGYYPNEEAARLIIEAADRIPEYQFIILGGVGNSLKDVDISAHPNLIITGFLEEQEKIDYLLACDIAINPMLSGSGTNIKMFEFMAAGLPILTTDIGARGIENTNGRVYLLCEKTIGDFCEKIKQLMKDQNLRNTLIKYGRKEAEEKYSWETISYKLGLTLFDEYTKKATATEKVLMVSTYPPEKCGIGAYAAQQVAYLKEHGANVDVWAIQGNGTYTGALNTPDRILSLMKLKSKYDRIIIQYHGAFYYQGDTEEKIRIHQAFTKVCLDNPHIEIVAHEISYPPKEATQEYHAKRKKWMVTGKIYFHTLRERTDFCSKLNIPLNESKMVIVAPNYYYTKNANCSQEEARGRLQLPLDKKIYLCIGFIQPHKAFDKVADVFTQITDKQKQFYMVGSLRLVYDETIAYLQKLEKYAKQYSNIFLKSSFLSDEMFDLWLIACDVVVIPYQEIWSSGVLGRAKLFEKTCIAHNVGGLKEQLDEKDTLFDSYDNLLDLIKKE